jgi:hypothetical protein
LQLEDQSGKFLVNGGTGKSGDGNAEPAADGSAAAAKPGADEKP